MRLRELTGGSDRFKNSLIERLLSIHSACLQTCEELPLESILIKEGSNSFKAKRIQLLEPTANSHLFKNFSEFRNWQEVTLAFIQRAGKKAEENFRRLSEDLESYILFQRTGRRISDATWKEVFRRESTELVLELHRLIDRHSDCFRILNGRSTRSYEELFLQAHPPNEAAGGLYSIIISSRFETSIGRLETPVAAIELQQFTQRHCGSRQSTREWVPTSLRSFGELGKKLYDGCFKGEAQSILQRLCDRSTSRDSGVAINLDFSKSPELNSYPWELLFDGSDFLALSKRTSIIRRIPLGKQRAIPKLRSPLRILLSCSQPHHSPALSLSTEVDRLKRALAPLTVLNLVQIDLAPDGTLGTLRRMLNAAESEHVPYQAWHFMGHGFVDDQDQTSFLVFEDSAGEGVPVSGFELGTLLAAHRDLSFAIINSCNGAVSKPDSLASGVATGLLTRGLDLVIAMQFSISDNAALIFSEEFYMSLADGLSIEASLAEARRGIFFSGNLTEWITPVIYRRAGAKSQLGLKSLIPKSRSPAL